MRYFLAANARAAHRLIDIATHSIRLIHKFRIFSRAIGLFSASASDCRVGALLDARRVLR
jgi:hypothetical protein